MQRSALPRSPTDALRVVVLDDDPVFRSFLTKMLTLVGVEVVGVCSSVESAKKRIALGDVDAVSIDVVLRGESGLDFLAWCHATDASLMTVLVTSGSAKEAHTAVDAVFLGAAALLTKPDARHIAKFEAELRQVFADGRVAAKALFSRPPKRVDVALRPGSRNDVLVMGASTGGPPVLLRVLEQLPVAFDVPIVIAQHLPQLHIPYLAERLAERSGRTVIVPADRQPLDRGVVYLAGHGKHLQIERGPQTLVARWFDGPAEHSSKPAVDVLFRSVAKECRGGALGVVLTGMGEDGAAGAAALRASGNPVLVQDAQSSVVWGMPGAVVARHLADAVLPAERIAAGVVEWMGWRSSLERASGTAQAGRGRTG